jgi:hypothetical protein
VQFRLGSTLSKIPIFMFTSVDDSLFFPIVKRTVFLTSGQPWIFSLSRRMAGSLGISVRLVMPAVRNYPIVSPPAMTGE